MRNELKAVVNSRNPQMSGVRPPQSPLGQGGPMQLGGGGSSVNSTAMSMSGPPQMPQNSMINTMPDPTLGFNFDTATGKT